MAFTTIINNSKKKWNFILPKTFASVQLISTWFWSFEIETSGNWPFSVYQFNVFIDKMSDAIFISNWRISSAAVPYKPTYTVENLLQRLCTFANLVFRQYTPIGSESKRLSYLVKQSRSNDQKQESTHLNFVM